MLRFEQNVNLSIEKRWLYCYNIGDFGRNQEFKFERNIIMTKTDLVNVVAAEAQISKKDADAAVNAALAAITAALKAGDKVQLLGFGTFEVKAVAERDGRNPKTGEAIKIAASKKPAFTASKVLKDEVNA